jgi:SAM-dependent methyltransferase
MSDISAGHYAAKQIFSSDRLVRWTHRSRYETGVRLAAQFRGRTLLDYGCGDGTFLAMLCSGPDRPAQAVGAEIDEYQVTDCRRRLQHIPGLGFELASRLEAQVGRFDGVVCMEVLEHVVDVDGAIRRLWRLLKDEGTLIVSVPVETGLPLLVKQAVRRVAGWRGVGDYCYTSSYTLAEYWAGVTAGSRPHMPRPTYGADAPYHDHKGFNWMALREQLTACFALERTLASPLPWLGPRLASQVWLVLRKNRL